MSRFRIHPQLLVDCHVLGRLKHCHVLLHKNALVPWFILVPETGVTELLEVPAPLREQIMGECAAVAAFIKRRFHSTKINLAALGNLVPQLHLHVIGRSDNDACWPRPVWGNLDTDKSYITVELEAIREDLQQNVKSQE